jgi:hypothetical protein
MPTQEEIFSAQTLAEITGTEKPLAALSQRIAAQSTDGTRCVLLH